MTSMAPQVKDFLCQVALQQWGVLRSEKLVYPSEYFELCELCDHVAKLILMHARRKIQRHILMVA